MDKTSGAPSTHATPTSEMDGITVTHIDGRLSITWPPTIDSYAVPSLLRHAAEQAERAILGQK